MNSYESQFRAIVGEDYDQTRDLGAEQARALSALIFGMPLVQVTRDGSFITYEGWSEEQGVYLSVMATYDHKGAMQAICEPHNRIGAT
ncbi:hypothetical protein [Rhizobium sp. NFR03]|uniref:hypothetical protein n=1 Tax=Rhizobium sp. NFR03 TaxID=1566263 RepID=UPI0008BF8572|nr:hypothetical protein [Rhizobium sp. NFR03]SER57261.1 hypothetical protein SAMN03159406_00521 [Rhizobium sp. NFR03]